MCRICKGTYMEIFRREPLQLYYNVSNRIVSV